METLIVCLQGLVAGGIVGIPLSPIGIWAIKLRFARNYVGLTAILLGGSLGDTALAWAFLSAITVARDYIPEVVWFVGTNPLTESAALVLGGSLLFALTLRKATKKEDNVYATAVSAFVLAFAAGMWFDNLASIGLIVKMLHIEPSFHLTLFIANFFIADLAMGTSVIFGVAGMDLRSGDPSGVKLTRVLCGLCVAYGLYLLSEALT